MNNFSSEENKSREVVEMFNDIAPTYDKINRRLSFSIDVIWRRKLRKAVRKFNPQQILDMSAGTGDLTIELSKLNPKQLVAADPSEKMLEIAEVKLSKAGIMAEFVKCSAEATPFASSRFDLITCSFGVRNFASLEKGLKEMHRILAPGGHFVILEFGMPTSFFWRNVYKFYFNNILPLRGRRLSRHNSAYTYLNQTVQQFPYGKDMVKILTSCGFETVRTIKLSGGIAWMYVGRKI
ncbi:MAG: bifunctional demethylmenaquinone methyltransferase/2-methoxy-6-polyprenyl-1,4-benzoquinol methylase [Bacteroidetes bacterium GWF2_43_63]|nr:MAG: bifunctional demethylmenaquinone methyltransferase/2-methoxy-6-polyprenyl-1,4-benzoquinol methylase [Bacteroidetes bacterium GWE2_42_42]OFY53700.1 MAG: bifunctional demethylmenaquinone methyltransferase/2-methoxy-6-polyprenyl-1,4-benzoquinol methylase [Bacteroidetes bacterium GWF2_43_63]HBG70952.1 bifunctional demethylmenaquinone methyltransferase/2-methoxy-6-polyprenyl-1,4-benzoquinol methylase UbiE [Bacteroidales bacterium]HCB62957.1 bifunctional demethylmenaquinone methyltransferase/2